MTKLAVAEDVLRYAFTGYTFDVYWKPGARQGMADLEIGFIRTASEDCADWRSIKIRPGLDESNHGFARRLVAAVEQAMARAAEDEAKSWD